MPHSYGNAKDFYNRSARDGGLNKCRGLQQFSNPSKSKPKVNDLLIYSGHLFNKFDHVAIVSEVTDDSIEIVQQNPGAGSPSRERINHHIRLGNGK